MIELEVFIPVDVVRKLYQSKVVFGCIKVFRFNLFLNLFLSGFVCSIIHFLLSRHPLFCLKLLILLADSVVLDLILIFYCDLIAIVINRERDGGEFLIFHFLTQTLKCMSWGEDQRTRNQEASSEANSLLALFCDTNTANTVVGEAEEVVLTHR